MTLPRRGSREETVMAIEVTPALGHYGNTRVAFSPDGQHVLTACHWTVKLWKRATGQLIRTFRHDGPVGCLAMSADGALLIAGSGDVALWAVSTGERLRTFKDELWLDRPVVAVAFSPDGGRVLAARGSMLDVWDTGSGEIVLENRRLREIGAAAFSADAGRLLAGGRDGLSLLDTETGEPVLTFKAEAGADSEADPREIEAVALSADGARAVSAGRGRTPQIWDTSSGALLGAFEADPVAPGRENRTVGAVTLSPDGALALTSGGGLNAAPLKLWDMASGRLLGSLTGGVEATVSAAWSPDGEYALAGSANAVFFKRRANPRRGQLLPYHGVAELWDVPRKQRVRIFQGHVRPVSAIAFSGDGGVFASASHSAYDESCLQLWNAGTGRLLRTIKEPGNHVVAVALSRDGARIASFGAFDDGAASLKLWDAATGALSRTLEEPGPGAAISYLALGAVAFSPDGARLASDAAEGPVKLWDAATGASLKTFEASGPLAFSPDGTRVAVGGRRAQAKPVTLWDVATGQLVRAFKLEETDDTNAIAFSPDGAGVLAASLDGAMTLWACEAGDVLRLFDDREDDPDRLDAKRGPEVLAAAFSPDGALIASGSADGRIRLWNAATGARTHVLDAHAAEVNAIAISPDGARMLSAGNDSAIRMWSLPSGELLASFIAAGDEAWTALTPAGFFAGPVKGAALLNLVRSLDVQPIEPFYDRLFRPDLVEQRLRGDPEGEYAEAAAGLDLDPIFPAGDPG
jgi:WD40 repeat protein